VRETVKLEGVDNVPHYPLDDLGRNMGESQEDRVNCRWPTDQKARITIKKDHKCMHDEHHGIRGTY
jgi:hypothetical protein